MSWFKVVAVGDKKAELYILDQIGKDWWTGDGTVASEFINAVKDLGEFEEAELYINSPGGDVGDGLTIANYILSHPAKFTARVTGRAASIASVIACACDVVEMCLGTTMLVHKPSAFAGEYLTADGFRNYAEALDKYEEGIVDFYMNRVKAKGKTRDELSGLLRQDRVMTAAEAIEWGFADSEDSSIKAVACADLDIAKGKAVQSAQLRVVDAELTAANSRIAELEQKIENAKPVAASAEQVLELCNKEKLVFMAAGLVANKVTKEQLNQRLAQAKAIAAVCSSANISPDKVLAKIDTPAEMLGLAINEALAAVDPDTDSHVPPGVATNDAKAPNAKAVYNQLNNI